MATLPKVMINQADTRSAAGVALHVRTQALPSGAKEVTGKAFSYSEASIRAA